MFAPNAQGRGLATAILVIYDELDIISRNLLFFDKFNSVTGERFSERRHRRAVVLPTALWYEITIFLDELASSGRCSRHRRAADFLCVTQSCIISFKAKRQARRALTSPPCRFILLIIMPADMLTRRVIAANSEALKWPAYLLIIRYRAAYRQCRWWHSLWRLSL